MSLFCMCKSKSNPSQNGYVMRCTTLRRSVLCAAPLSWRGARFLLVFMHIVFMSSRRWFTLLLFVLIAPVALAQNSLQAPDAFLGYTLGDRFTPHHRVMDYVEHVAAQSPNVQVQPYGKTYEGRPLLVAYVGSASNLARLEEIRTNNLKRAGLLDGEPTESDVAIVWLSYNVHGNESVSTEAAMQTLYELADTGNRRTQAWLENAIIILDPCLNPDGRDRYVHWYNETVGRYGNVHPAAREHSEPWPGGRTNHYYFDLNRDWAWMVQQESQQRLVLFNQWLPHVHVDFHEQGVNSPYYFAPAAAPFHDVITPWQSEFQTTIGENHMRYFDQEGWLYFTREVFDLLYPSYGDTYPTYNGSIGMTYEKGGSGRAGLGILTAENDTLTLATRILHHHTTGLSTVEATANNHTRVVSEFASYYGEAQSNPPGDYKTYVVKGTNNPDKLTTFTEHLDNLGIAYGLADGGRTARGFAYQGGATSNVSVDEGDIVVSAYQPKARLVKVLFEPETFVADSVTYDITAWALPYAYGLDAYALTERVNPGTEAYVAPTASTPAMEHPYAYVAEWTSFEDAQFLAAVLKEGIKLRFANKPFTIDGRSYPEGTLIITRIGNEAMGDRFDTFLRETAAAMNQALHPVATGGVSAGSDFGSNTVSYLEKPHVGLIAEGFTSSYGVGEVWHFFDQQLDYPLTVLHADAYGSIDLDEFDVLILASGSYSRMLTESRLNDLKDWIRGGGRLIAIEGAASFLVGKSGFNLERKENKDEKTDEEKTEDALRRYGDRQRESVSNGVPGAIFELQFDNSHPLGYGYGATYHTLKRNSSTYAFLENGWNVGALRQDAHVSGFVGAEAKMKLEDILVYGVQHMGGGAIIYMADNPLFRGFWYNGKLLFSNAVFMVAQ